ncbi:unnamed protein product [Paramecium pentaurelia]|uniref:Uncharacterized protein n=1 Tax=Paramecium pentaurelia TaxID=43138 RepID=A0A8S1VIB3_9CILI|nr:unnamed protein product [Paramecium pentaurelia]
MGNANETQAKELTYVGKVKNGKKVGKHEIWWRQQKIGGGKYDKKGNESKIGKWVEVHPDYKYYFQLTSRGEYQNGKKVGKWDVIWLYEKVENKIAGGLYNNEGDVKVGKWIDLDDSVSQQLQIIYVGDYENGKKIGSWIIYFNTTEKKFTIDNYIGGGKYEQGVKNGLWSEQSSKFSQFSKLRQLGWYKNGKKYGKWTTQDENEIGEEQYDGNGNKIGKWIEIQDYFLGDYVNQMGEYQNNKRVGRWTVNVRIRGKQMLQMGGGMYDDQGMKLGHWTELENYENDISQGNYHKDKKVGKWRAFRKVGSNYVFGQHRDFGEDTFKKGGYDEKFNQVAFKISASFYSCLPEDQPENKPIQQHQNFDISYKGDFNNGRKVGKWQINFKINQEILLVGGGHYDQGSKTGMWVDISDSFCLYSRIHFAGCYYAGEKRHGKWKIGYAGVDSNFKLDDIKWIGGGEYDLGIKIGKWIDVREPFASSIEKGITYCGVYLNGKKIGKWDMKQGNDKIGGGLYTEDGSEIKIGKWIELADENYKWIHQGEYNYGKKVGKWIKKDLETDKIITQQNFEK